MEKNITFIREAEFVHHFKNLLQLTRSAIFSFVFAVRGTALKEKQKGKFYVTNEIPRQDYLDD